MTRLVFSEIIIPRKGNGVVTIDGGSAVAADSVVVVTTAKVVVPVAVVAAAVLKQTRSRTTWCKPAEYFQNSCCAEPKKNQSTVQL
jgi:hypothetical protein